MAQDRLRFETQCLDWAYSCVKTSVRSRWAFARKTSKFILRPQLKREWQLLVLVPCTYTPSEDTPCDPGWPAQRPPPTYSTRSAQGRFKHHPPPSSRTLTTPALAHHCTPWMPPACGTAFRRRSMPTPTSGGRLRASSRRCVFKTRVGTIEQQLTRWDNRLKSPRASSTRC